MTEDSQDVFFPEVMGDLILHRGRYPECLVLISLLYECQKWGAKKGVLGGMEDMVILDAMDDFGGPQGSYPESFRLVSLCSVKL